ncbi:PWP1 homolog no child left behind isoform X2 [Osmia lignaria lignaria]|uniref:PWP1 homolog no child left behind isoform X2 n=1 Tax=Osmia lignaria lignaria TaxID=1437193 RepID=UPI00402B3249
MDISDEMDKSWDHPWTTEEMRKKRREWSLAGDAGLLKHLQQFSENLVSKANKVEETLDSLTTQLHETTIFIDNVTNRSLALANTQFIESRVQEDDIEIEKKVETSVQECKDQDLVAAELIATVSDSIKQGLNIMNEKYKEMEFVDSDSEEEEDEDNKVVLSVVGPNNPYQDRPLPYVIGSEKWKNSSKIGLESSSSSESEQVDEEESDSEADDTAAFKNLNLDPKSNLVGLLPSLNDTYNKRNDITYMDNDKMDVVSQNNIDSISESVTPNNSVPKVSLSNDSAPNFAEELAKRLGTVRQAQKPTVMDEKSDASINRFKEDLFAPEEDENVSIDKSKNILSESKKFVNDQSSENLWKEKPIKPYKNNIIPASIDVPPPISAISTKPKSAIDDLFADADSEDSDDIFSSKNTVKTITKNKHLSNSNVLADKENAQKKFLDIVAPTHMATSTPDTDVNTTNLFSDDEDMGDLFGSSKNQPQNKKKPVGGISILGNILTTDVENKLSSRISRTQSSGSSGTNTPTTYGSSTNNEPVNDRSRNNVSNDNVNERDSIEIARNNAVNLAVPNESNYSSGISNPSWSINNTVGSSIGINSPQMTSTRLKSEEIYRERVVSDSLFSAQTRNPISVTPNSTNNQSQRESNENVLSTEQDDVFENEDLFGPPPLPKADSKLAKSKVSSLFDDSDSGDELFSTTSSGSRSQKSSDFFTSGVQHPEKAKTTPRKGLFDEEIDIFGNKDSPDIDIFGIASKSPAKPENNISSWKIPDISNDGLFASNAKDTIVKSNTMERNQSVGVTKKISLFDDEEDIDDGDLFGTKPVKNEAKSESRILKNDDDEKKKKEKEHKEEDELFSAKKQANDKSSIGTTASGTDNVEQDVSTLSSEKVDKNVLSGNSLFSNTIGTHGLVFEDDDYDDLFSTKSTKSVIKEETKKESVRSKSETIDDTKETLAKEIKTFDESNIFAKAEEPSAFDTTSNKVEEKNDKDVHRVSSAEPSVAEDIENETKKSPPKSLDIQTVASSSPSEENDQGTKRTVSGKIKNLMGKMGDLKILSPMDVPPLWRRSEEKTDEEDSTADRDSDDGGCISIQEDSATQKQSLQSTISGESNVESAISFDEPVQVETLSTTASKTRVRIQAKRRPQSRYARKSALTQIGIDFDTVDASESNSQHDSHGNPSQNIFNKDPVSHTVSHTVATSSDRLISDNLHRTTDANIFLTADDKSELGSLSKESSMSANKNTLLSPSTDEEDLFDVPPDLPEDPQKEDTLFGRAPILSPVEQVISERVSTSFKPLKDTHIKQINGTDGGIEENTQKTEENNVLDEPSNNSNGKITVPHKSEEEFKEDNIEAKDELNDVVDPLRDSTHDPLKDPSQLFAFVTKTPSPEKGKNLLFSEDDSLFSSGGKKSTEEQTTKKSVLDLFSDDMGGDLFSTPLTKPLKKPLKDAKISLFDDDEQDDEDDSLFGPVVKKSSVKSESIKKPAVQQSGKKLSLFDDDDNDTNLFSESSEQTQKSDSGSVQEQSNKNEIFASIVEPVKTSHITDIFADQSSGEDDIFASKTVPKKVVTSKSLFPSDDDDDDGDNIFGKKSTTETYVKTTETRSTIKKSVTKDLKKTAEKIGDDPLSILQDD